MADHKLPLKAHTSPAPGAEDKPLNSDADKARLLTGGAFPATMVVDSYFAMTTGTSEVLRTLQEQAHAIHQDDMQQVESMLINQAVALQTMFADLATRAKKQTSLAGIQCLTQLALKAQSGCRATLQTLAEIKNPRQIAFVKQTNVAQNQQVNNGVAPAGGSRAQKNRTEPNELLVEEQHGSPYVDTRAKATAGRADPAVGTVDSSHRPKKRKR